MILSDTNYEFNLCHLPEGNIATIRSADRDVTNRLNGAAVLRQKAHHNVKTPVPFQHLGRRLPTDGRQYGAIDIARQHAITGGQLTIGANEQVRLAERAKDTEVGHTRDRAHDLLTLVRERFTF